MSIPADLLTIAKNVEPTEAHDALMMALSHARSSVQMVELTLSEAANDGELLICPGLMATSLHAVETHLAAVSAFADHLTTLATSTQQLDEETAQ